MRALNGLVQISFWSWPMFRRNLTGLSLASCELSALWETGVGVGVGEGTVSALIVDCPQSAAEETQNTSMNASLRCPIGVNSFLRLERPDHANGHSRAGKYRDRLAQVLEERRTCALFRNEDDVSSLQGSTQNVT